MTAIARLFTISGGPASGKDEVLRAIGSLGVRHATVVPKHTSRARQRDDGSEMICPGEPGYALDRCEITYSNFRDKYGIDCELVWRGLAGGIPQVVVVSNPNALSELRSRFGGLMKTIFVYSEVLREEYVAQRERQEDQDYTQRRAAEFNTAIEHYSDAIDTFDHVLIHAGLREDLYDQIFRLFRAYSRGDLR